METVDKKNNIFKNIIRQMVKVSESAFTLSENVEILNTNINSQTGQTSKVQKENSDALSEVNKILEKATGLKQTSSQADNASKAGIERQKEYLGQISGLSESIEQGRLFISEFKNKSEEINKMTGIIKDLSGRLDVLSINGAIEAARQGAYGAGFGVIAREMKALAQETELSAKKVEKIVNNFTSASEDVQKLFVDSSESLKKSKNEAGYIYEVFSDIESHNENIKNESDEISVLVESLVKRNELQERSAEMILEGAEKSAFQIGQVHQQSEQLHNVVKDILENMGEVRLDWHDEAVKSVEEIAKDLSDCRINFNDYLKNCFNKYNFIELLYVMNGRGQQIDNNVVHPDFINMIDNSGKGADRSTRSYCRHIIDGENSYISGIYVSSASNHLCLTVSVQFFCRGEAFILAADLNLEKFVLQS